MKKLLTIIFPFISITALGQSDSAVLQLSDLFKEGAMISSRFSIHENYQSDTLFFFSGYYRQYIKTNSLSGDTLYILNFTKKNKFNQTMAIFIGLDSRGGRVEYSGILKGDFYRLAYNEKKNLITVFHKRNLRPYKIYQIVDFKKHDEPWKGRGYLFKLIVIK